MSFFNLSLLLLLSAIWGGSFAFMRYLAPIFGPVATADMRMLIAGVALVVAGFVTGFRLDWKKNWRRFLIIGLVNSGLPFLFFTFAALYIPASVESILNALTPTWGVVFAAIWLGEALTPRRIIGILVGTAGVVMVCGLSILPANPMLIPAIIACVLATCCYGLASMYLKKKAHDLSPRAITAGSMFSGGLVLLPAIALAPPKALPHLSDFGILVAFALLCSAVAYLIYFKLIKEIGPAKTLTVTFLIPIFGIFWGALLFGEPLTPGMILGVLVILAGTGTVTLSRRLKSQRKAPG